MAFFTSGTWTASAEEDVAGAEAGEAEEEEAAGAVTGAAGASSVALRFFGDREAMEAPGPTGRDFFGETTTAAAAAAAAAGAAVVVVVVVVAAVTCVGVIFFFGFCALSNAAIRSSHSMSSSFCQVLCDESYPSHLM